MTTSSALKFCPKCREWKEPTSENFNKDKARPDGLQGWCKLCQQAYIVDWRRAQGMNPRQRLDPEIRKARRREYDRAYNEAHRDKRAEQKRRYQAKYPAKARERNRRYRAENRERMLEKSRAYYAANRESEIEKAQERNRARRAQHAHEPLKKSGPAGGKSGFDRLDKTTGFGFYLQLFLNAKATKAKGTISNHRGILSRLAHYVDNRWPFTADDIDGWLATKKAEGCGLASINGYYRSIRAFCAWLVKRGKMESNPIHLAEKPPTPRPLPRVPKKEDVRAVHAYLKSQVKGGEWLALRNVAMFSVMLDAGLRVSEVAGLDLADINLSERTVILRATKTNADGVSIFGLGAAESLRAWLAARAELPLSEEAKEALFVSHVAGREWRQITKSGIALMLRHACEKANARHISPHLLRHGCAVFSLQNGAHLIDVQKQLRHKNPTMTLRYLMMNDEGREARHLGYSPFDKTLGGAPAP